MIFWLTILIAFIWLGYETTWLTVRLPTGSREWHDNLPYDVFYQASDFAEDGDDLSWNHTEEEYRNWLDSQRAVKYIPLAKNPIGRIDRQVDYPQDRWLRDFELQDMRRNGEMPYQRGSLRMYKR